jgi:hypothetical protein
LLRAAGDGGAATANVDKIEDNGWKEWAAMEKGLCKVVDSVDKCGKLCRTENNEAG